MTSELADELKLVIESQHGGSAKLVEAVRIVMPSRDPSDWDGIVFTFEMTGHATANHAYAWAVPITGSSSRRYFAVLQTAKLNSPLLAVKAVIKLLQESDPAGKRQASPKPAKTARRAYGYLA